MMKKNLSNSAFLLVFIASFKLTKVESTKPETVYHGQWTWVDGSKISNAPNTFNASHKFPGARYGATTWKDRSGNVWMFDGHGQTKPLQELWLFNTKSKSWSLVDDGAKNISRPSPCVHCASCFYQDKVVVFGGVIKRKGKSKAYTWILDLKTTSWTALQDDNPPVRVKQSYWCDASKGILYIYGGDNGAKIIDDMWKFSFKDMAWSSITFSKLPTFPGSRFSATAWENNGTLYLFGGQGELGLMSDLWAFNPLDSSWTKIKGSANASAAGVYNLPGNNLPGKPSLPGCRRDAASWSDKDGNLWMFGGGGCDNTTGRDPGFLSDLWLFNTSTNQWCWAGGLPISEGIPTFGLKMQTRPQNLPGPREAAVRFTLDENLWLFGGSGHDVKGNDGVLNDLWVFGSSYVPPSTEKPQTDTKKLPGDTLDMSYAERVVIAFVILAVVMTGMLAIFYRKECNIWCWRQRNPAPKVKYEQIKSGIQVPDV
ncbi:predicted protein [Nematostella vectensis]|uniref:Uncharacterized protein n=1 Tax=Nematostella vectensis TaxID=45351 RepID=A7S7Z6_NEMVE|nr:predicted protein [Nematostella vectensis]|eukprot:XP_001632270.1 predicted protein [Nematostella vectensis]